MEKSLSFKRSSKWDSASFAEPAHFRFFQRALLLGVALFSFLAEAQAFSRKQASNLQVWVRRNDGSISCEPESGEGLEQAEERLRKSGVSVFGRRKSSDGLMRAMVCGMPQGNFNEFLVRESQQREAKQLGYERMASQEEDSR